MYTLGVDPGLDGAAVLLDPMGRVLVAVAWHSLSWTVRIKPWRGPEGTTEIHEHKVSDLHAVGVFVHTQTYQYLTRLPEMEPTYPEAGPAGQKAIGHRPKAKGALYRLAVEGLFGHGPTLAGLAWEAGLVAGPLLIDHEGEVERPLAMTWRPAVLGIRGNDKNAGLLALRLAPARFPGLGTLATDEHTCEAACIAEYVRTSDRRLALPPQPSLPLGKTKKPKKKEATTL
jgi:hypothetical protein